MDNPIEMAVQKIFLEITELEKKLNERHKFIKKLSELSGISVDEMYNFYIEKNIDDENEDDIIDSGRKISQEELEKFVLQIILCSKHDQCNVETILENLKINGFDPGGANKRKNLTTRLWRLSEKNKNIVRLDDGIYGLSRNKLLNFDPFDPIYRIDPNI